MRTIGNSAYDEATGQQPQWLLEIDIDDLGSSSSDVDPLLFSSEDDVPVEGAVGRVLDWGELTLAIRPGQNGHVNTVAVTLADPDRYFHTLQATKPGLQGRKAYIKLYFAGSDPVTIFGGVISAPLRWSEDQATWTMTIKDFSHLFDKNLGKILTVDVFSEIDCQQCENRILPIVFGNPCYRVPACVIDRPGRAQLGETLLIQHNTLTLNCTAAQGGFTSGTSISLIVGVAGFWERVTGIFASSSSNVFTITSRGAILASGTLSQFGAGGQQYLTIDKNDLADEGATSRAGYPLHVQDDAGTWYTLMVTYWEFNGTSIITTEQGQLDVGFGDQYILGSVPGWTPVWQAGTPVHEVGNWTYAVNSLPSKSVDRIEGVMNVSAAGRQRELMATINSTYYSVNLNNKTYNAALGREASDPGITTVTLSFTPIQIGSDTETIYATIKGATSDLAGGGTIASNPADVIEMLLSDPRLGNIDSSFINSASFTAAKANITTQFSFALLDEKIKLHQVVTELANQANCALFWDQGQAHLKFLDDIADTSDSVLTIDNDNRKAAGIQIEERDHKEYVTELIGKFRPAIPAEELLLMRTSAEAKTHYDQQREEINFWGYQYPSSVALATENWLRYHLHRNRRIAVTTFLCALHVQPGDVVSLDLRDGANNVIASGPAQVMEVRHRPGNVARGRIEEIELVCEMNLWQYEIEVDAPTDEGCAGDWLRRHYGESHKYFLRTTGTSRSLYIGVPGGGPAYNGNLDTPIEPDQFPTADLVVPVAVIASWQPRNFVPPPGATSESSLGISSGDFCVDQLDGVVLSDLPVETAPAYVLALDASGCLIIVQADECA